MDENTEYDLLLRTVFDSCDRTGSGFLSPAEFRNLCSELCLEEQYKLLYKSLFTTSCSQLYFERFREVLLLLLAGTLCVSEDELDVDSGEDSFLQEHEENIFYSSIVEKDSFSHSNMDLNANRRSSRDEKSGYPDFVKEDWLLYDLHSSKTNASAAKCNNANDMKDNCWRKSSGLNGKRHSRRSLSDPDLTKSSWPAKNSSPGLAETAPRHHSVLDAMMPSIDVICEEFVGEGDGDHWTNPDLSFTSNQNGISVHESMKAHALEDETTMQEESSTDAEKQLQVIWHQVIGDLEAKITVYQLQELFRVQALSSSASQVQELFQFLDKDRDGLIVFEDVSCYMQPDSSMENDRRTAADLVANEDSIDITPDAKLHSSSTNVHETQPGSNRYLYNLSTINESPAPTSQSTPLGIDGANGPVKHILDDPQLSIDDQVTSPMHYNSNYEQPSLKVTENSPDSRSNASIGNDVAAPIEEDDTMRSYHGVPRYRRRRSTQSASRNHRRRSHRLTSLPPQHPAMKQALEDCPLFFLGEEQERVVDVNELRLIWQDENVIDPDQVLVDLGANSDETVSIPVLNEAFEREIRESPVHHAACALYKNGLRYFRSQRDHERLEKKRLQDQLALKDHLILENEEKLENMEVDSHYKWEEEEKQYKVEISTLMKTVENQREQMKLITEEEMTKLQNEIENLRKVEVELQEKLLAADKESKELVSYCSELEEQLKASESQLDELRSEFESVFHQMMICSQSHVEEQKYFKDLLMEYEKAERKVHEENEQLQTYVGTIRKRWLSKNEDRSLQSDGSETKSHSTTPRNSTSTSLPYKKPKPEKPPQYAKPCNKISFIPVPTGSRFSCEHHDRDITKKSQSFSHPSDELRSKSPSPNEASTTKRLLNARNKGSV